MTWIVAVSFLVLLAAWTAAWRSSPGLAFGIALGLLAGWVLAAMFGPLTLERIPVWLPPLPFAVVAVTLITLGIIAWRLDDTSSGRDSAGQR